MVRQKSGKVEAVSRRSAFSSGRRGSTGDWQQRALLVYAQTKKEVLWEVVPCGCCIFLPGLLNSVLLSNIG